jgi:hypothetical protein
VWVDVLEYAARDATPSYQVQMDADGISGRISGDGIESMTDNVRVPYDGVYRREYVDVSDSGNDDNYLATIGQGKTDILPVMAYGSSSVATLIADRYQATRRVESVSGALTIAAPIHDLNRAEVLPCEIEAGKYIRIHGSPLGTVDARITEIQKRGDMFASLTLDNTPTALDTELALLAKRTG